jgi:hypothetical protein
MIAPMDFRSHVTWLRLGVALVWLVFGLLFKAVGAVPRHRRIVARVVGQARSGGVLWIVALAEIGIGVWMLVGRLLVVCAAAQTAMIVTMNVLEIRHARDLLLSPWGMVCANAVFLAIGWYVALSV